MQRLIDPNSPIFRRVARLMVAILMLMPLLSQAQTFWSVPLVPAADGEMPCHQATASLQDEGHNGCRACALVMDCNCCDQATPHNLLGTAAPVLLIRLVPTLGITSSSPGIPYPPTANIYRPPIQPLI